MADNQAQVDSSVADAVTAILGDMGQEAVSAPVKGAEPQAAKTTEAAATDSKPPETMPVTRHVSERTAWHKERAKIVSENAQLKSQLQPAEVTPARFKDQAALDELEALAANDDADIPGSQARRMADLRVSKAEHDRVEKVKIDEAQKARADSEGRQATLQDSITSFTTDNPELAKVMTAEHSENLSRRDWATVGEAGDDAGQALYDLIVKRTPELRDAAKDSSQNQESETGIKPGKGGGAAKREPAMNVTGPMTPAQVTAWLAE